MIIQTSCESGLRYLEPLERLAQPSLQPLLALLQSYCTLLLSSVLCRVIAPYSCPLLALGLDNVAIDLYGVFWAEQTRLFGLLA